MLVLSKNHEAMPPDAMTVYHAARRPALLLTALCLALSLAAASSFAQEKPRQEAADEADETPYASGAGFEILLTNNGFGLGGYYSLEVGATTSLLFEMNLGAGKDERELKFFSRFGSGFIPNKRNYLLMLPLHLGVQQRLFSETIEDNFRPYLQLSGGPTLGWEYPYFADNNNDDRYDEDIDRRYDAFTAFPKGHLRFGLGGMVALGAYFGLSRKVTQGVRLGYAFHYFFEGIGLLEPDIKGPQHAFHTPVISITFGRLL